MTEEQERKLDKSATKVGQIHSTIFGVEGQGGMLRDHRDFTEETHREISLLRRNSEELNTFKAKALGVILAVSTLITILGNKIAAFFTSKNP